MFLFCVSSTNVLGMKGTTSLIVKELPDDFRGNYNFEISQLQKYVILYYSNKKLSDSDIKVICNLRDALANRMQKESSEVPLVHVYDSVINFFDFRFGKKFSSDSDKEIIDLLACLVDNEFDNITCPLCYADNYTKYTKDMSRLCKVHSSFFEKIFSSVKNRLEKFQTPNRPRFSTNRDSIFNAPKKSTKESTKESTEKSTTSIHGRNLTNVFESMWEWD